MIKFKVGDRVRNNGTGEQLGVVSEGVIDMYLPDYWVKYPYVVRNDAGETEPFDASQVELITEGETKVGRRTFRLLKDMPDTKKGALFQEQCEDGTQPYSIIQGGDDYTYSNRSTVEDNPEWFVEVFVIDTTHLTKEELAKWEAFKKTDLVVKRKYTKRTPAKREGRVWTEEQKKAQSRKLKASWRKRS